VIELAWFAAGAAVAAAAAFVLRARAGREPMARSSAAPLAAPPPTERPRDAGAGLPDDARRCAVSVAEELATLVSGVEGRAHALIECAPHRELLPAAAEALLTAIQRLRTLHNKLLAYGQGSTAELGTTDLGDLIAGLGDELQNLQLGLELRWDPPPTLPRLAANPAVLREALLFLCSALLRAERGATQLTIDAEWSLADDAPGLHLELALEWAAECPSRSSDPGTDVAFSIEHQAAANLIQGLGGSVAFKHLPGRAAVALVTLPVEPATADGWAPAPAKTTDEPAGPRHRYGGALVLEADPSIRAMLANELKATGRAVFACADGAAARSFLAATPERFELLIVDHANRLHGDDALGEAIRNLAPNLKICVLGPGGAAPAETWPNMHRIEKPFGVHELRQALASVLAAG
jgi:hypothetical protein